jgi:hypothetical protein
MAFRKEYEPFLRARSVTTVFRPGDRRFPAWRGYEPGEVVTARVIERVGSDSLGIPPMFSDLRVPIRIEDVQLRAARLLTSDDFAGSTPDIGDVAALCAHLQAIYGKSVDDYGGIVSRITFSVLDRIAPSGDG